MSGKGIDRHLFALLVVSRGQGYVSVDCTDFILGNAFLIYEIDALSDLFLYYLYRLKLET